MGRQSEGQLLPRLFHGFPDGRAGLGLLILRAAVGIVVAIQGALILAGHSGPGAGPYVGGSLTFAVGVSLLAGFLTPIAATLLGAAGIWILAAAPAVPSTLASKACVVLLAAAAAAIFLLGPGAFSIDARLFGWREIIIPPSRSSG